MLCVYLLHTYIGRSVIKRSLFLHRLAYFLKEILSREPLRRTRLTQRRGLGDQGVGEDVCSSYDCNDKNHPPEFKIEVKLKVLFSKS